MTIRNEIFQNAIVDKNIPLLILDQKWHQLFDFLEKTASIKKYELQLNDLLKRQGKLNTTLKEIHRLKTKLMEEIVENMDVSEAEFKKKSGKALEDNKRLVNECNEKVESYQEELKELPKQLHEVNRQLMLATMEECYHVMNSNSVQLEEIKRWISVTRVELKKNVVRKKEREVEIEEIYGYMHDIFGPNVVEIFDMKYNPHENKKRE